MPTQSIPKLENRHGRYTWSHMKVMRATRAERRHPFEEDVDDRFGSKPRDRGAPDVFELQAGRVGTQRLANCFDLLVIEC